MRRAYSLVELLERTAQVEPGRVFLEDRGTSLTYGRFWALACALAGGLRARGLKPGDRVGVFLEKSWQAVLAIYGIQAGGGVFVTVHHALKKPQLRHIIDDAGMTALVTTAKALQQLGPDVCELLQGIELILVGGTTAQLDRAHTTCFEELLEGSDHGVVRHPVPREMASLLYTSGSTGMPKGVVVPHETLVDGATVVAEYLDLSARDRILALLPLSFDYGFNQITSATAAGCTAVLSEYVLVPELVRNLRDFHISGLAGTPMIWTSLVHYFLEHPEESFPSLRYATNSGGAIPERHVRHLLRLLGETKLYLMYGLTEAFRSTFLPPEQATHRPTSIGKPVPGVEIYVLNAEGRPAGVDEPGELVHRGVFVNLGYYRQPEATAKIYRPNPLIAPDSALPDTVVFSGDLVRRDADGYLYFVERANSMIKSRGFRVSPEEVERVLDSVPGVFMSGVAGRPSGDGDEHIVAFLEVEHGQLPDEVLAAARKLVFTELPAYMRPSAVVAIARMPASPNGKLDRARLKQLAAEHREHSGRHADGAA